MTLPRSDDQREGSPSAAPDNGDDAPTQVLSAEDATQTAVITHRPSAAGSAPSVLSLGQPLRTVHDVLYAYERDGMRLSAMFACGLSVALLGMLPFLSGEPLARRALLYGSALCLATSALVIWELRKPVSRPGWMLGALGVGSAAALNAAFYLFGPFSAVAAVVPLLVFMLAASGARRPALVICALLSAGQIALVVLVFAYPSESALRGWWNPSRCAPRDVALYELFLQVIFFGSMFWGSVLQRVLSQSIDRYRQAIQSMARNDALLAEAQAELEHARQPGMEGRYTGLNMGSFTLGALLGRGAMGEVYEAVNTADGQPAAVKLLGPEARGNRRLIERFLREIRLVSSLRTPHVVCVLEAPPPDAPIPYLAMELLEGESLSERVRRTPQLKVEEALEMLRQVARGVTAAHEAGIVHRDLKPSNIFCHRDRDGREIWKVLDFGISKPMGSQGTLTGVDLLGTPAYMAPEQAQCDEVDHRADLYAMGVIAYRTITGRPAFSGSDTITVLYEVVFSMPVRPSAMCPRYPQLDVVLAVAMAKKPEDRFSCPGELVEALDRALHGQVSPALRARAARLLGAQPWLES